MIASLGFDAATNVLEVEFVTGFVYRYFGVPRAVVEVVQANGSVGSAFNHLIRDHYPCERVR